MQLWGRVHHWWQQPYFLLLATCVLLSSFLSDISATTKSSNGTVEVLWRLWFQVVGLGLGWGELRKNPILLVFPAGSLLKIPETVQNIWYHVHTAVLRSQRWNWSVCVFSDWHSWKLFANSKLQNDVDINIAMSKQSWSGLER